MKKASVLFAFLIVICLFASACSNSESGFYGKWEWENQDRLISIEFFKDGTFIENPKGHITGNPNETDNTWVASENSIRIGSSRYEFELKGNELTIRSDHGEATFKKVQ